MSRKRLIPIGSFIRDSFIKQSFLLALALLVFQLLFLLTRYADLPPVLPLFYSLIQGENQLADKPFIFVLPFINLVFFLAHLYIAHINFQIDRVFARLVATATAIMTFLITVALSHILLIVG